MMTQDIDNLTVDEIKSELSNKNPYYRRNFIYEIHNKKGLPINILETIMNDESDHVRVMALYLCKYLPLLAEVVARRLLDDESSRVRLAANAILYHLNRMSQKRHIRMMAAVEKFNSYMEEEVPEFYPENNEFGETHLTDNDQISDVDLSDTSLPSEM
jgi:hypothetical protein